MGNEKITFEQFCDPCRRREQQMKVKSEAVWVAFLELRGLLNLSEFSRQFFNKSQSWFSQKLYMTPVNGKAKEFSKEENGRIAASFRELGQRLIAYADAIDNAE